MSHRLYPLAPSVARDSVPINNSPNYGAKHRLRAPAIAISAGSYPFVSGLSNKMGGRSDVRRCGPNVLIAAEEF